MTAPDDDDDEAGELVTPAAVAEMLAILAAMTGELRYRLVPVAPAERHAGGRPTIDDTTALAEMAWHLSEGSAKSVTGAAKKVTRARAAVGRSFIATVKRLTIKYKANEEFRKKTS